MTTTVRATCSGPCRADPRRINANRGTDTPRLAHDVIPVCSPGSREMVEDRKQTRAWCLPRQRHFGCTQNCTQSTPQKRKMG